MFRKIFTVLAEHKIAAVIGALLLAAGGYWGYGKLKGTVVETRYVLATVKKETLITSISGSGQIAVTNQVDLKSRVSGDVLAVNAQNGQEVKAGAVLVQLDVREAQKAVRDAEANLASAKLSLAKLIQSATAYELLQAENALTSTRDILAKLERSQPIDLKQAHEAQQKADDALAKAYEDALNVVANAFLNLPTIINELYETLYSTEIGASEPTVGSGLNNTAALLNTTEPSAQERLLLFQASATGDYQTARLGYDANFERYKGASRYSDRAMIEQLLAETLATAKATAQAAKSESNYLDAWADYRTQRELKVFSKVGQYQSSLSTYIGQANGHLSSLLTIQRTLQDSREELASAGQDLAELAQNQPLDLTAARASVKERESSLAKLKAGPDPLDVQSQELAVRQRENTLLDAREKLADYTIRVPSDSVVAMIDLRRGDPVSASVVVATLITRQRQAQISLNEVDVAKVKVGQRSTLTFDAVEGLSIAGQVAEIDALGTVSQGVVTYNVKILFDAQDDRVKPGMSVSASIITNVKTDVLTAPSSAVKAQGEAYYVEVFDQSLAAGQGNEGVASPVPPRQQPVEVGLSNDTATEITVGLKEGDQVVTRTVNSAASQTNGQTAPSLFGTGGRQDGGAIRIPR